MRRQHEAGTQKALVGYHAFVVVNPLEAVLFAIPNGEKRDERTARLLTGGKRAPFPFGTREAVLQALGHPNLILAPAFRLTCALAMTAGGLGVLPGAADLALLTTGRLTFIETKIDKTWEHAKTYQSTEQIIFEWTVKCLGHDYRVIRSSDEYLALLIEKEVAVRARPVARSAATSDRRG